MLRCPELQKLTKAPRISSILWKHQSPGSITTVLGGGHGNGFLDPSHPAARRPIRELPKYKGKDVSARMVPVSLLEKPLNTQYPFRRHFLTWSERVQKAKEAGVTSVEKAKGRPVLIWKDTGEPVGNVQIYPDNDDVDTFERLGLPECKTAPAGLLRDLAMKKAKRRVRMSYFTATSKARMGALRSTRRIITLRMKAALNLIVTRGAYYGEKALKNAGALELNKKTSSVKEEAGEAIMKFDDEEANCMSRHWVMQGWSYVFSPTIDVYRMPYSKLIPILRHLLTNLNETAVTLENQWLANALWEQQSSSLRGAKPNRVVRGEPKPEANSSFSSPSLRDTKTTTSSRTKSSINPPVPSSAPQILKSTFDNDVWERRLKAGLALLGQKHSESRGSRAN